jgi:16S rRNA (guanine966-N2)-methyltransferase
MRVIAGSAGGIPLSAPKGGDVRPTMDLVKGAIFSSLSESIEGARVLDLFAGAGTLGIEALSRGAREVVFVEKDRRALATIEANLARTNLHGTIQSMDIFSYLDRLAAPGAFDIIFADPPYAHRPGDRDFTTELLASQNLHRTLTPGGVFILEHLPGAKLPLREAWQCLRQKRYGATEVAFLRRSDDAADV